MICHHVQVWAVFSQYASTLRLPPLFRTIRSPSHMAGTPLSPTAAAELFRGCTTQEGIATGPDGVRCVVVEAQRGHWDKTRVIFLVGPDQKGTGTLLTNLGLTQKPVRVVVCERGVHMDRGDMYVNERGAEAFVFEATPRPRDVPPSRYVHKAVREMGGSFLNMQGEAFDMVTRVVRSEAYASLAYPLEDLARMHADAKVHDLPPTTQMQATKGGR